MRKLKIQNAVLIGFDLESFIKKQIEIKVNLRRAGNRRRKIDKMRKRSPQR